MSPFAIYGWFLFSLNPQTCLLRVLFISFLFWGTASFVMGQDAPSGQKPKVVKEAANGGREKYRPAYHFTPRKNWMNDPNGMVYFEGEWHLFFQYNPFGEKWGHMSWGHAVSRDLVHWEELPLALPEDNGIMIFSGSAVVDWGNTSGFGKDGKPPLVAIYTGHREGRQDQRLAYSNDKGRTWTNYQGNPVLDVKMADFRDPKVFWNKKTQSWVMTVALAAEKKVHFYSSPDLKKWKYTGEFGPAGAVDGLWECPDLFPLTSKEGKTKWVLIVNINPGGPAGGSGCQYFVGEFDGARFVVDPLPPSQAEFVPDGELLADFEKGYGGWKVEGDAFGKSPASGTLANQMPVTGFKGKGLINSFHDGDKGKGTLTSPLFEISKGYLSFLIGGGAHKETRVDLLVGAKVVRTATGKEMERLTWQAWDVREFRGKSARIQVVDNHTGGWGHINFDHPILSDDPARPASEQALWADFGSDFYAGVSWSDVPEKDGRRIWLGWLSNWNYANEVPTTPWRSGFSVPRVLGLKSTDSGYRLVQSPVAELKTIRGAKKSFSGGGVKEANEWIQNSGLRSGPLEMILSFEGATEGSEGIRLYQGKNRSTVLGIDRSKGTVFIDRTQSGDIGFHPKFANVQSAPLASKGKTVNLHIFVDTASIEVFVNDGEQVLSSLVFPTEDCQGLEFFGEGKGTKISNANAWSLSAIQGKD